MNELIRTQSDESLPVLIERALLALENAKTSAEILEAGDMASMVYAMAKKMTRLQRAQNAHEDMLNVCRRMQGDALLIEGRAKIRLADEYDRAQQRGEIAKIGDNLPSVTKGNANKPATSEELGINRKMLHEARQLRNFETKSPGKIASEINGMVERGEEPTKARLKQAIADEMPAADSKPKVKIRMAKALSGLTREALEEDVLALMETVSDLRGKNAALKEQNRKLKEELKGFTGDEAATIRSLTRQLEGKRAEVERANDIAAKALAKAKAIEKRLKEFEQTGFVV